MDKTMYSIEIKGCDASNYFEMELTEQELEVVKQISQLSRTHSTCDCEPVIKITKE